MPPLGEILKRLYHDLAVRRSTVRIVPAGCVSIEYPPIFIVGVYRSGTTLLRYILDSHRRICCPPESNFIRFLEPLVQNAGCRTGLSSMGFDRDHSLSRIRDFCVYFFGNYASSKGKPRWADKTPAYVDCLDFLKSIFPEARFLLIHRHALDQAHSFALATKAGGGAPMRQALEDYQAPGEDIRLSAVRYWREKTRKILDFESANREDSFRLRYEDLCDQPESILRVLFEFLGEEWDPAVLKFYDVSHDIGAEDGRALTTRGFSPSVGNFRKWPLELVRKGLEIARPDLLRLGYSAEFPEPQESPGPEVRFGDSGDIRPDDSP